MYDFYHFEFTQSSDPIRSLFKSWYFSTFPLSVSPTLTSAATAMSMIIPFPSFLPIIMIMIMIIIIIII